MPTRSWTSSCGPALFERGLPGAPANRLDYRLQPGHDHSYWFVASFIGEHVRHHAEALGG